MNGWTFNGKHVELPIITFDKHIKSLHENRATYVTIGVAGEATMSIRDLCGQRWASINSAILGAGGLGAKPINSRQRAVAIKVMLPDLVSEAGSIAPSSAWL